MSYRGQSCIPRSQGDEMKKNDKTNAIITQMILEQAFINEMNSVHISGNRNFGDKCAILLVMIASRMVNQIKNEVGSDVASIAFCKIALAEINTIMNRRLASKKYGKKQKTSRLITAAHFTAYYCDRYEFCGEHGRLVSCVEMLKSAMCNLFSFELGGCGNFRSAS